MSDNYVYGPRERGTVPSLIVLLTPTQNWG
jgi:hypothetical protein